MNRSKKILIVCHCILNVNSKIEPLAKTQGVFTQAIDEAVKNGVGLFQLPCPELGYLGMNRFGMTKEQYDNSNFRKYCLEILEYPLAAIANFVKAGYEIVGIVGMDGSPNCGINYSCRGYTGGELCSNDCLARQVSQLQSVKESGVFIEIFLYKLKELGVTPKLYAVAEQ